MLIGMKRRILICVISHCVCAGESEPVYSSRNPASPSFGNPGGIFTYPNGHNNSVNAFTTLLVKNDEYVS